MIKKMSRPNENPRPQLADRFEPTHAEARSDKELFQQLRYKMTHTERLWVVDCQGDYRIYRLRLRALARDYGIPVPPDVKPEG